MNADERAAVGHEVITGSSYDALKLIYPSCYPVYDPTGAGLRAGGREGVRAPGGRGGGGGLGVGLRAFVGWGGGGG